MCFCLCFIQDCSEFKSGEVNNMLRNNFFDEKGVFGRVIEYADMNIPKDSSALNTEKD